MSDPTRYLVTSALPYANGEIHLGHLAGAYLPADVFVRYCRMQGRETLYVCGSDEHGVPITLGARAAGETPQEFVDRYHASMKKAFAGFGMSFDNYSRTSLPLHHETSREFFVRLRQAGAIVQREVTQLYCPQCEMFLSDRYVEGTCPKPDCGAPGARGDQCETCGSWLKEADLIDPHCKTCATTPEARSSRHWYLRLNEFQDRLAEWIESKSHWRDNVRNFCRQWFARGLDERAITRDLDWGIPVPDDEGKVLYVWFDAPIGYISSTKEWAARSGDPEAWRPYWQDEGTKIVHFIGKDNIVFHALSFPATLMAHGGYQLVSDIPANEFLNIEGRKLSTSRGYAVWLPDYLAKFPPDPLRYYLAMIDPETQDTDFSWAAFQSRNNSELADIIGNFVHRTLTFARKYFDGVVPPLGEPGPAEHELFDKVAGARDAMALAADGYRIREMTQTFMLMIKGANRYFDAAAPWKSRKDDLAASARAINACLQVTRWAAILMQPVLPFSATALCEMLSLDGDPALQPWAAAGAAMLPEGHRLGEPRVLFRKIEDEEIAPEVERLRAIAEAAG